MISCPTLGFGFLCSCVGKCLLLGSLFVLRSLSWLGLLLLGAIRAGLGGLIDSLLLHELFKRLNEALLGRGRRGLLGFLDLVCNFLLSSWREIGNRDPLLLLWPDGFALSGSSCGCRIGVQSDNKGSILGGVGSRNDCSRLCVTRSQILSEWRFVVWSGCGRRCDRSIVKIGTIRTSAALVVEANDARTKFLK